MARLRRVDAAGRVEVVLDPGETAVLSGLPTQLRELLEIDEGRVRERLFPPAYLDPTEEAAEAEWQRLMHADLLAGKLAAVEAFSATFATAAAGRKGTVVVRLEPDDAVAWLGVLNDLRLALGVMLEVTEDLDLAAVDPDDPRAPGFHLYGFLTWLQGDLVEALDPS